MSALRQWLAEVVGRPACLPTTSAHRTRAPEAFRRTAPKPEPPQFGEFDTLLTPSQIFPNLSLNLADGKSLDPAQRPDRRVRGGAVLLPRGLVPLGGAACPGPDPDYHQSASAAAA